MCIIISFVRILSAGSTHIIASLRSPLQTFHLTRYSFSKYLLTFLSSVKGMTIWSDESLHGSYFGRSVRFLIVWSALDRGSTGWCYCSSFSLFSTQIQDWEVTLLPLLFFITIVTFFLSVTATSLHFYSNGN